MIVKVSPQSPQVPARTWVVRVRYSTLAPQSGHDSLIFNLFTMCHDD